ncbi:hypothetical protein PS870_06259 [Pseudomonas fluorescens]|uniref:Calcium-mediated lectin domain-containing protein n=1 Tax=Pseudomonas fluorescens TaxID=294 RepID=A0A5E7QHW1_PSEFL|nr:fucose-binding lectin II [Pseudomonas fluorescens]VVP61115.1 hypothetical protein PS870_06259 [Pseudomonas fluorescens]
MSNTIKYGDAIALQNNAPNWSWAGGFLATSTPDATPYSKFHTITVDSPTLRGEKVLKSAVGMWRVLSGQGKPLGTEIQNNDIILLKGLNECDGGLLAVYGDVNLAGVLYRVNTSLLDPAKSPALNWKIILKTNSPDGKIRENDPVSLINQYQPGTSFLSTAYEDHNPNEKYFVYTSVDASRKENTGYWRFSLVAQDPCPDDVKNPTITVGGDVPIGGGTTNNGGVPIGSGVQPVGGTTNNGGFPIGSGVQPAGGTTNNGGVPIGSGVQPAGDTTNNGGVPIGSGVQPAGGNNTAGDTSPRWIPIPVNTQFTVTMINNEQWVRTAKLNIDGKEESMDVQGNKATSKAFTTKTGEVSILMFDSQSGAMRTPLNIAVSPLGAQGSTVTFGAEKPKDEALPAYMDVFVHIDWATHITN